MVAGIGQEDVYHDIDIVHGDPDAVLETGGSHRFLLQIQPHLVAHRIIDCLYLTRRAALADDKGLCYATVYLAQVYYGYVTSFLVLNAFNGLVDKSSCF